MKRSFSRGTEGVKSVAAGTYAAVVNGTADGDCLDDAEAECRPFPGVLRDMQPEPSMIEHLESGPTGLQDPDADHCTRMFG